MFRKHKWTLLGLAYGLVLFVFAFGAAGAGHGTYLLFAIFGSPFALIPLPGVFIAPFLWAFAGWLMDNARKRATITLLALHMSFAAIHLTLGSPMEPGGIRSEYFTTMASFEPSWILAGAAIYLAGQLVAWLAALNLSEATSS